VQELIKSYPDFPKKGVTFKDLNPVYEKGLVELIHIARRKLSIQSLCDKINIDYVLGIEARGFILGAGLAHALGVGFIPVRKRHKLPGKVIREAYELEYSTDIIEIQENDNLKDKNILIVDDVFATGGTMTAAISLLNKCEVKTITSMVVMDIGIADINKLDCFKKVVLL